MLGIHKWRTNHKLVAQIDTNRHCPQEKDDGRLTVNHDTQIQLGTENTLPT